jgi:hypothetical protein
MQRTTKQIIAAVVTILVLFVAVCGSYLPMRKAEMYIGALQSLQTQPVTSLQDLENRVSPALDAPSPIGQEELVRNFANSVLGFIQNNQDATNTMAILGFLHGYYDPILAPGKGMSFGQDLYLMGAIHEIAFVKTGNQQYLALSKQYYEEANTLGPNRPQALYGLFDVYRFMNDMPDAVSTAQKILTNWPTDQSIKQGLAAFEMQSQATSTKK